MRIGRRVVSGVDRGTLIGFFERRILHEWIVHGRRLHERRLVRGRLVDQHWECTKGPYFQPLQGHEHHLNWDTNVATTDLSGSPTALASDLAANGGKTITLAFATGECGSENFGGVEGATMASANVPFLTSAGVDYIVSTGGAAGSFTCGSDAGFETFVGRWASSNLVGVDFDIEAGQSQAVITALVQRIQVAHGVHPGLRFSLTLATLANNDGASSAQSLGGGAPDSFNVYGDEAIAAANAVFGGAWPSYLTFQPE